MNGEPVLRQRPSADGYGDDVTTQVVAGDLVTVLEQPQTSNVKPTTSNLQPQTPNLQPQTQIQNPKPKTANAQFGEPRE